MFMVSVQMTILKETSFWGGLPLQTTVADNHRVAYGEGDARGLLAARRLFDNRHS